jgi:NAD(P)-dependent dehydrogenase (short-subunit alcohol dehydrogenase family)
MSKVVLITGGSSGIGRSIGEFLLTKNYCVYGTSRNPERCESSKFPILKLDVTQQDTIDSCVATVLEKEGKLDVLVNNAGVGITGPIEETPEVEMKRNFDINFFGPIRMIKAVLPQMRSQSSGLIINITSIAGYMGLPYRGIYSSSKAALEILTEALRIEIKDFKLK